MMLRKADVLERLRNLFGRTYALYVLLAVVLFAFTDSSELRVKILNEMNTPLDYLIAFCDGDASFDRARFREQAAFYERLQDVMPEDPGINGVLGLCYYYLGEHPRAVAAYRKAMAADPDFFWYPYNLGWISYRSGEDEEAREYFRAALQANLPATIRTIAHSRIYRNFSRTDDTGLKLLSFTRPDQETLRAHLMQAYAWCVRMVGSLSNEALPPERETGPRLF